ncbi:hypothetical protein ACYZT4_26415 [Pseudomonas sp. GB2N2]
MYPYPEFLIQEQKSQRGGAFRLNSLFTRLSSDADLNPDHRDAYAGALAVNVHEYVHYLHNVSTPCGIVMVVNAINFLYEFLHGTDEQGAYHSPQNINSNAQAFLQVYKILLGRASDNVPPQDTKILTWKFSDIQIITEPLTIHGCEFDNFETVRVGIKAQGFHSSHEFSLDIGHHFITEGVAYEVEREIRRRQVSDVDLDEGTPAYPYLAYEPLINYLIGRKSSLHERIILGTTALMNICPGKGLLDACKILKIYRSTSSSAFLKHYRSIALGLDQFVSSLNNTIIPQLINNVKGSEQLEKGIVQYLKILRFAVEARKKAPFMEVSLSKINSADQFYRCTVELAPFWVYQQKNQIDGVISWMGERSLVNGIDEPAISTLQSIFDYVQIHIKSSGSICDTSELPNVRCPFSGACAVESKYSHPKECRSTPWKFVVDETINGRQAVCFYNSGVRSLHYRKDADVVTLEG